MYNTIAKEATQLRAWLELIALMRLKVNKACTTKNILVRKCLQVDVHYVFVVLLDDSTGKCQYMIFGK